jgi:hypothetical protein
MGRSEDSGIREKAEIGVATIEEAEGSTCFLRTCGAGKI